MAAGCTKDGWMDGWMAGGMDGSRVMDEEGAKKRAKEQGAKE